MSVAHDARFNPLPADLIDHPDEDELLERAENPEVSHWAITDDGAAEWAMRRLAEIRRAEIAAQVQADEWIFQVETWVRDQVARNERSRAYFEAVLIDYARARREADDKAKTLNLPSGKVTSRAVAQHPKVVDADALIDWAQEHEIDSLIRWKASVVASELQHLPLALGDSAGVYLVKGEPDETGQVELEPVPGVVIEPETVTFKVSPAG